MKQLCMLSSIFTIALTGKFIKYRWPFQFLFVSYFVSQNYYTLWISAPMQMTSPVQMMPNLWKWLAESSSFLFQHTISSQSVECINPGKFNNNLIGLPICIGVEIHINYHILSQSLCVQNNYILFFEFIYQNWQQRLYPLRK